jgi:hypothetical protein
VAFAAYYSCVHQWRNQTGVALPLRRRIALPQRYNHAMQK